MEEIEEKKEFIPKPLMVKFARLYLDTPSPRLTYERICQEIGISRRTVYNWLHKKEFKDWLNSKRMEVINDSLIDIYKIAVTKAKTGDFNFCKLILEMSGNYIQGMKLDTGQAELIRIEVVQGQAQIHASEAPESIESHQDI